MIHGCFNAVLLGLVQKFHALAELLLSYGPKQDVLPLRTLPNSAVRYTGSPLGGARNV